MSHSRADQPRRRRTWTREVRKNATFRAQFLALLALRLAWPRERWRVDIECHPEVPGHRYLLWKVALLAGMRLVPYRGPQTRHGARARLRLLWLDDTKVAPERLRHLSSPEWRDTLNRDLVDISKRRVEQVFATVFGYPLAVDPGTHRGPLVAKSDRNATHDGRVLEGPVAEPEPGVAYERLVDNRADAAMVVDYRVPVIGGEIPFVHLKYRPLGARFALANTRVALVRPEEVLSGGERERLLAFARAIGLDLGELDVLRDVDDGRIYVVDVSGTPFGPPRPTSLAETVRMVRLYAASIRRQFAARACPPFREPRAGLPLTAAEGVSCQGRERTPAAR